MKKIKNVLVPTDFSSLSLAAYRYVVASAELRGACVYLMNVLEALQVHAFPQTDLYSGIVLDECMQNASRKLHRLLSRSSKGAKRAFPVVRQGEASGEIVRFAREKKIDLIVMATHGRTGLAHLVMGSIAEQVVRHSPVPVLLVKPKKTKRELGRKGS